MTSPPEWIDTAGMRQEIDSLNAKLRLRPTREEVWTMIQRLVKEPSRIEQLGAAIIELRESVLVSTFRKKTDD
jgi:hypothetical protein